MRYDLLSKTGISIEFPAKFGRGIEEFMQQGIDNGRHLLLVCPDAPFFQRDDIFDDSYAALELEPHNSPNWKKAYDQVYLRTIRMAVEDARRIDDHKRNDLLARINSVLEQI